MLLTIGDDFAGYRVLRLLGSGGMGEVYLVQHPRLPRQEALKVLRSDFSQDASFRERFIREADLASGLRHPNIVGIHDRGEHDGQLWIAMEYIDGTDLSHLLSEHPAQGMPIGHVLPIVDAVAGALDYAHLKGLLHRDVKPANIIVADLDTSDPKIYLADFGIARPLDDTSGLTTTNMTVGTVAYAAPEQLMGENIDGRADQYALAATAFQLLSGFQMFGDSNPAVVISRHLNAPPPKLADTQTVLAYLDSSLHKALSKDPLQRFTWCGDFARSMNGSTDVQLADDRSPFAPTMSALAFSARAANSTAPESVSSSASAGVDELASTTSRRGVQRSLVVAAALAIVIAVTGLLVWRPWTGGAGAEEASGVTTSDLPISNTGPFTGIYTAGFGPEIQVSDRKVLNPDPASGTFEFRSTCGPTGCVAIANAIDGPTINRKLVFDQVGTEWISVGTGPSASPAVSVGMHAGCEQGLSPETWESLIVRPASNGDFTGQYEAYNANNCNTSRTVYFKRTGDVDLSSVDDPAELPARVVSPAENWRGRYRYTSTRGDHSLNVEGFVRTDCLRTGERCMSYFSEPNSAEPFVFADGRWTLHYEGPVFCGGTPDAPEGPRVQIDRSAELELPDIVTTPINLLEGRGQEQVPPGPCGELPLSPYNLRFERLGD